MSKPAVYVTARSGGRLDKTLADRSVELFLSKGNIGGDGTTIAHVMNYCLEHRIAFTYNPALCMVERAKANG